MAFRLTRPENRLDLPLNPPPMWLANEAIDLPHVSATFASQPCCSRRRPHENSYHAIGSTESDRWVGVVCAAVYWKLGGALDSGSWKSDHVVLRLVTCKPKRPTCSPIAFRCEVCRLFAYIDHGELMISYEGHASRGFSRSSRPSWRWVT